MSLEPLVIIIGTKFGRRLRIAAAKRARAAQKSEAATTAPTVTETFEQPGDTGTLPDVWAECTT